MNNNMNNNQNNQNQNQNQNENEKKEANKMAEAEKKSAFPILSVGITWVLFALTIKINSSFKLFAVTVLSFIVYQIVKSKFPPKKIELMMEPEKPETQKPEQKPEEIKKDKPAVKNPELEELNTRIFLYLTEMNLLNEAIKDPFISGELYEIENTLKTIQTQLNDDTKADTSKRITQLSDFFDYYMPTTIKILNSYRRIESQNLTGDNAMETKKRVEETLPLIKKAFAKELDNLFTDEMMDITTDIDVLESMLSKDGLIDKNNLNNIKNMDFFN